MTVRNLGRGLEFAGVGFVYGALLSFFAGMSTGGGHGYIMFAVFTSPLLFLDILTAIYGTPFVWMLIGFLVGTLNSIVSRFALLAVMALHYGSIPLLLDMSSSTDWRFFTKALRHEPGWGTFYLLVYAAGHVTVWWLFIRSVSRK